MTTPWSRRPLALTPLPVPWRVDLATPQIELIAAESGHTRVLFAADFGPALAAGVTAAQAGKIPLVKGPDDVRKDLDSTDFGGRFQQVELAFAGHAMAALFDNYSDRQPLDPALYRYAEQEPITDLNAPENAMRQQQEQWQMTGICPEPGFYRSERRDLGASLFEFLILGKDGHAVVHSSSWAWRSLGSLIGW